MIIKRAASLVLILAFAEAFIQSPQRRLGSCTQRRSSEDPEEAIPQEVIDAEEKSSGKGRNLRIAFSGVVLAASCTEAVLVLDADNQAALFIVGSPEFSLGLSLLFAVGSVALAAAEINTQRDNQQRIWMELKRRRENVISVTSGPNRLSRRSAAPTTTKSERRSPVDNDASFNSPAPTPPSSIDPAQAFINLADRFFPEANAVAKVQATRMNAALEEKGFLQPSKSPSPSAVAETLPPDEQKPPNEGEGSDTSKRASKAKKNTKRRK